jgi:transcriptional regulator with GAF, ATPase, and Fis domain
MAEVYKKLTSVAKTNSTVLLTGETGVGKGVLAKLIHIHSKRSNGPFISVHCGAISENLIESELFGHEKGSFTGADKQKRGRFELAQNGTIFLDEIGTLSLAAQIKLLHVLQDLTFQRVGGEVDVKVDCRIIVATNENLEQLVAEKKFRSDLFYRINVFPIDIPPQRERIEDLEAIINLFISKFNEGDLVRINSNVLEMLKQYNWPGNIREVENIIERACLLSDTGELLLGSFPEYIKNYSKLLRIQGDIAPISRDHIFEGTIYEEREKIINSFEKSYLIDKMQIKSGKIKDVAELSGLGLRQTHKLLKKYGIDRKDFLKKSVH